VLLAGLVSLSSWTHPFSDHVTPRSRKNKKGSKKGPSGTNPSSNAGAGSLLPSAPGEHSVTVRMPFKVKEELRIRLTGKTTWNTTSVGNFLMPRNPSIASNWSKAAGLYDEFKVIGMRMRVAFPKYITLGDSAGSAPISSIAEMPASVAFAYDNDSNTPPGYTALFGYDESRVDYPDGLCVFGVSKLPLASIAGSTGVGGSLATAEWCDTTYPANMYGSIFCQIDRLYSGSWGVSPATLASITVLYEWDVVFRGRNVA
jgi:hypothetical protein